jgi:hypothetical protein
MEASRHLPEASEMEGRDATMGRGELLKKQWCETLCFQTVVDNLWITSGRRVG